MKEDTALMEFELSSKLDKYKIAEAYIKLKLQYNDTNKAKIRKALLKAAEIEISEFKYKDGLIYVVLIEKGSIKAKIIIYGTVIIQGISNYGAIRQGLDLIWQDAKRASEYVINRAKQNDDQINDNTIERTERRTGLIGRIKRILDRIDYLERNIDNIGHNQVRAELSKLRQDMANILELLNEQDKQAIMDTLSPDTRNNLPNPTEKGMRHLYNQYALKPDDIDYKQE
jgi:hypothetical protein